MNWLSKEQDKRRIFIDALCELAEHDKSIMLIICDTGFNYIEEFQKRFPKQFLNLGVTEPFAMTFAAGLSAAGRNVWIYSMIPFVTFRVHEQIRNMVVKHNTSVKILGVEGGASYSMLGFSHNLLFPDEEIEWMEKLMPCYKPKVEEVRDLILKLSKGDKPSYIRL